ncbi:MAG: hypothetical protein J0L84_05415, partial [Verrucomicrobia bacterium]|nr:hypothetical protein [Verrucomicrobiota bacterium]
DEPEDWLCGQGLVPLRGSRLLRRDSGRIGLERGEVIDGTRPVFSELLHPTGVGYSLPLLVYRATRFGSDPWEYVTIGTRQESELDLLIGVKALPSLRYGWIHLTRSVADAQTPFELVRFVVHPAAREPIGAGMEPALPILHAESTEDGVVLRWDARWGQLVLESATRLTPPSAWQQIAIAAGGPVRMQHPTSREFFRLRYPHPISD